MNEKELLDGINQSTKPDETFKHGYYFQLPGRVVGLALTVVGFFCLSVYLSFPCSSVCLFFYLVYIC